jgi:4-amino-4-deoxy-L-arabinose transferase-like glycosyltransferase
MPAATLSLQRENTSLRGFGGLFLVLLLAFAVRMVLFNGPFGSDDSTYFMSARRVAQGDWSPAHYNGALRFGFNLPAGGLMYLLGQNFIVANLWPLSCSLLEIAAIYWFADRTLGRRAAWIAALLLACTPLHVAVATRIHADSVVSAFLTLGFVCIYQGVQRNSRSLLFAAGLSIGMVFWAKELAAVCYAAFLPLLWYFRDKLQAIVPVVAGAVLMLALNGLLMYIIAGDPLHAVRVVTGAVQRNFIGGDGSGNEAWFYLPRLFIDVRHVGLLGWVALLALGLWRNKTQGRSVKQFLAIWWLGLLFILSCFPVSLSPLRLTMKQSNYITLFLAPMAVLGGAMLAQWSNKTLVLVLGPLVGIGLLLAALQQADYRAYVGNSKAVAELAMSHANSVVLGSVNNSAVSTMLGSQRNQVTRVLSWKSVQEDPKVLSSALEQDDELFGIFDPQTTAIGAGANGPTKAPACWKELQHLPPQDLGIGNHMASGLLAISQSLPAFAASRLSPRLEGLAKPSPATLYRVSKMDPWCTLYSTSLK